MYKTSESFCLSFLVIGLIVFVLAIFTLPANAVDLPFDPNDYTFLVYVPKQTADNITPAMDYLGITYHERSASNPVTLQDLANHDILIVGENSFGNINGLHADDLLEGITGRIILSGHDADEHIVNGSTQPIKDHAETFLVNAIDYVLKGGGTGMLTLGDVVLVSQEWQTYEAYAYLPAEWGVAATPLAIGGGNDVTSFTSAGLASGVYDGLDPNDFDNWGYSYHDIFTIDPESLFVPFENGMMGTLANIVTIARNSTYGFTLTKADGMVDPNDCIIPGNEITYTLEWSRDSNADNDPNLTNDPNVIYLIDYLPEEVDGDWNDPNFYPSSHAYRWCLGTVNPGDWGTVQFVVTVDISAVPLSTLVNRAYLTNYEGKLAYAKEETPVCCWGGDIIFVDENATNSYETGVDWQNSYTKLEYALARAEAGCGREIWVARGNYTTGSNPTDTFKVVAGVEAYGGFVGNENSWEQRDPLAYKAYLTSNSNNIVVTIDGADDPNDTVLDGFVVSGGSARISCNDGDGQTTISHCIIVGGGTGTGISVSNSDLNILDCLIKENGNGINLSAGGEPFIDRCMIYDNEAYGVHVSASTPTILNSCLHHNGMDGIYLEEADETIIRNDTLAYNGELGVNWSDGSAEPGVANCILWGNNGNDVQYSGCSPTYSCIYDPNDPNNNSTTPNPSTHNLKCDPNFAYPNPAESGNYHLAYDSPCKDRGDTNLVGLDELDIDGEYRIDDTIVDMGADEIDCEDVYNPRDWVAADGLVNLLEYAVFSASWESIDPNHPDPNQYPGFTTGNWNPICDLSEDLVVDLDDLVMFCDAWLWRACWRDTGEMMGMMMMTPGGGGGMELSAVSWSAKAVPVAEEAVEEAVPLATLEEMTAWLEEIYGDNEEFQQEYSSQQWQEFIDEVAASWPDSY